MMKKGLSVLAVMLALAALTGVAHANSIIPTLSSITPAGPNFAYSYHVILTNQEKLDTAQNSAFFTIYDFHGLVPGSESQPAGWSGSEQNTGITPTLTAPIDDPGVTNITWTYIDSTVINGTGGSLGTFSALSSIGPGTQLTMFAAQATKDTPIDPSSNNTVTQNIGSIETPTPGSVVPEPASLTLFGLGGGLLGLAFLRRRLAR
jgi:hypothetical protein